MTTNLIVIQVEDLEKIVSDAVTKAMINFQRPDEALKVKDAAKVLSCCEKEVYRLIREGELRSVKKGIKSYRVPRSAIDEYLQKSYLESDNKRMQFQDLVERDNRVLSIKQGKENTAVVLPNVCRVL